MCVCARVVQQLGKDLALRVGCAMMVLEIHSPFPTGNTNLHKDHGELFSCSCNYQSTGGLRKIQEGSSKG